MKLERISSLSSFTMALMAEGRVVFTRDEAIQALQIGRKAFLHAAERLQRRDKLLHLRKGLYVVVPPQYLSWGAPPPDWYIDDLMRHEGKPYYVALLKAAELHGSTHHAVMEFQVITSKQLPQIRAGKSMLAFYFRKLIDKVASGIEERKTDTGRMKVSSVELTALDLLRYPHAVGSLDAIATVLSDLGPQIRPEKLGSLAETSSFFWPVVQRLGHLLDHLGHKERADELLRVLNTKAAPLWVELDPTEARDPDFTPEPIERDERWRVIVRRRPEVDT